jgi:hypothetical protein
MVPLDGKMATTDNGHANVTVKFVVDEKGIHAESSRIIRS